MAQPRVAYLIFDIETVSDGALISRVKYPGQKLSETDAINKYRAEIAGERTDGKDFIPYTYALPVSVAVAKVTSDYRLLEVVTLDPPTFRPHVITSHFWNGWRHYGRPTFVTFNGRTFDLPVMELAAFRYGISLPDWFNVDAKSFDQLRNRYNTNIHIDLQELLSNFGTTRMNGGLNLIANLIGKPGKTGVEGSQVQDMFFRNELVEINDYCMGDVLDTYFVFLRSRVLIGQLTIEAEQERVSEAKAYLESKKTQHKGFQIYLDNWGDWHPPEG
jgi:hypothetical protein